MSASISPSPAAWTLPVAGLTPFTTIDFPGRLAAVVYTQGCAWRCRYCHNPHLWPFGEKPALTPETLISFLERRRGFLDGVVFCGGEPTAHAGLPGALKSVRSMGFETGLHTTGMDPGALAAALPLCDWVGMDVKAPFDRYEAVTRVRGGGDFARRSLEAVLRSGVEHEFRTTYHPALLSPGDLAEIAATLAAAGVRRYAVQRFRAAGCPDARLAAAGETEFPEGLADSIRPLFSSFIVR